MPKRSGRKRGSNAYNPIDVHVGNRLRARRTLLGLTQTTLAEAIGLTFQQMQKYEKGSNRISASRLYNLSQILAAKFAKAPGRSEDPLHKRETLELVRAYYRITDPTIRTHVRKLVQSTASASNPST
jgi:transcriptional regulator with XRE-family HTH domain